MPNVGEDKGVKFTIEWRDHLPPHVHAKYGGDEALFEISDASVYSGWLPKQQQRDARAWVKSNKKMLQKKWDLIDPTQRNKPREGIDIKKKKGWF